MQTNRPNRTTVHKVQAEDPRVNDLKREHDHLCSSHKDVAQRLDELESTVWDLPQHGDDIRQLISVGRDHASRLAALEALPHERVVERVTPVVQPDPRVDELTETFRKHCDRQAEDLFALYQRVGDHDQRLHYVEVKPEPVIPPLPPIPADVSTDVAELHARVSNLEHLNVQTRTVVQPEVRTEVHHEVQHEVHNIVTERPLPFLKAWLPSLLSAGVVLAELLHLVF